MGCQARPRTVPVPRALVARALCSDADPCFVIGKDHGMDVRNPATGEVLAKVEGLTAPETDVAIARAAEAFGPWRAVAPGDRARLLRRFAAAVDAHLEELAG